MKYFFLILIIILIPFLSSPAEGTGMVKDQTPWGLSVTAWVYLEGAAIDPEGKPVYTLPMRTDLNDKQILPGQCFRHVLRGIVYNPCGHPYGAIPWNHKGNEGAGYNSNGDPEQGRAMYPGTAVDWVMVSLRQQPDEEPLCQSSAMLHSDGSIDFVNGSLSCTGLESVDSLYIVIEHRNHLIIMSAGPVEIIDGTLTYDFRYTQSYGNGQKQILPGIFAMYAGNGDQTLEIFSDTDINFEDNASWSSHNGLSGNYLTWDYNLNGDCNYNDRLTWEYNNGIYTNVMLD
jgi:hypothetical protein